jgi:hypothetical protein
MRVRGALAVTVLSVLSGLTPVLASPAAADTGTGVTPAVVTGSGLGFDACTAPSTAQLRAWTVSPFKTVNMYFSGHWRACSQPELSADWVTTALANGWSVIPTVVDLQAPCYGNSKTNPQMRMSSDPATAASQGQSAATQADSDLKNLGLGGTIAYLDFENFRIPSNDTTNCQAATLAFAHAWVTTLHGLGDKAGIYFNANPNQGVQVFVDDYPNSTTRPDDIWYASYDGAANTTTVPLYPDNEPTIPSTYWQGHRIHQYRGGQTETYGGVSINIDRDAIGGDVVGAAAGVATPSGPPYTYYVVGASALNERTQPNGSATIVATANRGTDPLPVVCQAIGQSVDGDSVWDKLSNGAYVSDIYTSTTGRNGFSAAIPKCDTTGPTVSLRSLPAVTLRPTVTIRWSATDGTDPNGETRGISASQVRYRIASYRGGFGRWHYRNVGAAFSNVLSLGVGHSYCVQVRSFDLSGNSSFWSRQSCLAKPLDDRSMTRSSGWIQASRSHFYVHTVTSTTRRGRVLARTHSSLDRVGIVATTCAWCGSVRVYVGSHYVGTVNLRSSRTVYRHYVPLPAFRQRSTTVKLVTTSNRLVQIDGIVITRT